MGSSLRCDVNSRLTHVRMWRRNASLADALCAIGYSDSIRVGEAKIKLKLNTFIYSAGIGYRS